MNQALQNKAYQNQSLFNRAQEMASGKTEFELNQIAKNICASKGIDYESALKEFKTMWYNK